jgi:hypothetical protein
VLGNLPGCSVFADLCREVLADPRDRLQLLVGERGDIFREPVDILGGPMVRPDPEDVFPGARGPMISSRFLRSAGFP